MRKEKIILVHGWSSSPEGDWFPWVIAKAKELGFEIVAPEMPNPDEPEINSWVSCLGNIAEDYNENTIFIGHSIGCQTIMRFLEKYNKKAKGAIFVSGWLELINLEDEAAEKIAKPWIETPINFEKVKNNIGKSIVLLGSNDQWVVADKTKKDFEEKLNSEVEIIPNSGHITSDDGFGPFPKLIEEIEKLS